MSHKIEKYRKILQNPQDIIQPIIYQQKLEHYIKSGGGNKENTQYYDAELQKPMAFHLTDYKLDVNTSPVIKAIGYGTDRRDHPLMLMDFDRRAPRDDDVVIEILYCGVCHSDWHVNLNEWKNTKYPIITGHEITGRVAKVGVSVKRFAIGDKVAVGPNYFSCRNCQYCQTNHEEYCMNDVTETYNMPDYKPGEKKPTGPITQGGYSNVIVVNENYVLRLPNEAPMDKIAPVLCAGITMYTPLKYLDIKAGHKVGIAGIGGLGHIGIKLAKSFGAEVIALTQNPNKVGDINGLGPDKTLLVKDMDSLKPHEATFDLIIDTIPFNHDLLPYIDLIKPGGTLWIVGSFFTMAVDFDKVNRKGRIIRGSSTGGIRDTQECINYCVENNVYPDIELINIKNLNDTHRKILLGEVKFRYVVDMSTIY